MYYIKHKTNEYKKKKKKSIYWNILSGKSEQINKTVQDL